MSKKYEKRPEDQKRVACWVPLTEKEENQMKYRAVELHGSIANYLRNLILEDLLLGSGKKK